MGFKKNAPPSEAHQDTELAMTRPLIGVNTDVTFHQDGTLLHTLRKPYTEAIWSAGGRPVLLPAAEESLAGESLAGLDGLLLTGGDDLDPRLFGKKERHPEEVPLHPLRERFDLALLEKAVTAKIPILCICLGFQELAVAFGGTLHQSLRQSMPDALEHGVVDDEVSCHEVLLEEGTALQAVLGPRTQVNSTHRQAVAAAGTGQTVTARAPDGVIEAIELPGEVFRVGLQWHPELLLDKPPQLDIFRKFVTEAARYGTARG